MFLGESQILESFGWCVKLLFLLYLCNLDKTALNGFKQFACILKFIVINTNIVYVDRLPTINNN